jgi:hypothetical protein
MRITVKVGVLFASGWILVKLSLFGMGKSNDTFLFCTFLNMFFLIMAITVGLYLQKRKDIEEGNSLRDIKNGMSTGVPYAVIISLFLFFYYSKIDPEYNRHQINESAIALEKELSNPAALKKLKEAHPDFEVMTVPQIRTAVLEKSKSVYNAKSTAVVGLLAMTLYSTLNSIFITIIFRKIVFRNKN